jgi:hypothetical protein
MFTALKVVGAMPGPNCARCRRSIAAGDTVQSDGHSLMHVNCGNPRSPSAEELVFLYVYCWDHAVAQCPACGRSFRQHELTSEAFDVYTYRTYRCPPCGGDLTESLRGHLTDCAQLPEQLRHRVQEAREVAQRLLKRSHQLVDRADVLRLEIRAALADLNETRAQARRTRQP